jgi:hypothetical protein
MASASPILELGLILLAAAALGWFARRIGLPAVIGYLLLGVIVSPFTPGVVADREQIQLLADVGVVLLLFEVGIEVDLLRLRREQRRRAQRHLSRLAEFPAASFRRRPGPARTAGAGPSAKSHAKPVVELDVPDWVETGGPPRSNMSAAALRCRVTNNRPASVHVADPRYTAGPGNVPEGQQQIKEGSCRRFDN